MRSFHRSSSARSYFLERGEPSAEKHIQNLVSCAYSFQLVIPSLSRVSLSPHPPGDSHRPLAPPNIIDFIHPGGGGELGGDLRVVWKRRFQKQVSKSPCSTHQTSPLFRHFFDAFHAIFVLLFCRRSTMLASGIHRGTWTKRRGGGGGQGRHGG